MGKTFIVPLSSNLGDFCLKIQFFETGVLSADTDNIDCNNSFTERVVFGIYDTFSGNKVLFKGSGGLIGWSGHIAIKEDPNADDIEVTLITFESGDKVFEFDMFFSSCTAAPTFMPSAVPSVAPSIMPSTKPSSIPSLSPTSSPVLAPSTIPTQTQYPTLEPSSFPSSSSECLIDEILGRTFVFKFYFFCVFVEIAPHGVLGFVLTSFNQQCSYDALSSSTIVPLSSLNYYTDKKAYFNGTWTGEVIFTEDRDISHFEPNLVLNSLDDSNKLFHLKIILPSCEAPSISPTSAPQSSPTTSPTMMPSLFPSTPPSAGPDCVIKEVIGKTYYFSVNGVCLKVDFSPGGTLSILQTNEECTGSFSSPPIEQPVSIFLRSTSKKAVFWRGLLGSNGWSGDMYFRQNPNSDDIATHVRSLDLHFQTFSIDVILPSCDAPSASPISH